MKVWTRNATAFISAVLLATTMVACSPSTNNTQSPVDPPTDVSSEIPTKGGQDAGEVVFAHSASITQIVKLPQMLALEQMEKDGYTVDQQYLATTTDSINAVIRGAATMGNSAPANFFAAVANGADIVAIAGGGKPDFEVVGRPGIKDVCDSDAQRVAINNPISTTDLIMRLYVAKCADGGDKEILAVPLTPNRLNALLANQIDVAPVQLFTVPMINRTYADQLSLVSNVAEAFPEQISTITFVKRSTLEQRPKAIYDFVMAQQKVIDDAYDNPSEMIAATKAQIPSVPEPDVEASIALYLESKVFPESGGLQPENIKATYDALVATGMMEDAPDIDPEDFIDRRFVDLLMD